MPGAARKPSRRLLPAAAGDAADAEVRKVDTAAGKFTPKHGEIEKLELPA